MQAFSLIVLDWFMKGAGHKYVKRVAKPGGGYRYFYRVQHGGGVHREEHFAVGSAFRYGEGHYHVTAAKGDQVTIRHDETGATKTVSKQKLANLLREHHAGALQTHTEKLRQEHAQARETGSAKQVERIERELRRLGQAPVKGKSKEEKKAQELEQKWNSFADSEERAEAAADAVDDELAPTYAARVWQGKRGFRVYVTRLGRDVGFVEIGKNKLDDRLNPRLGQRASEVIEDTIGDITLANSLLRQVRAKQKK